MVYTTSQNIFPPYKVVFPQNNVTRKVSYFVILSCLKEQQMVSQRDEGKFVELEGAEIGKVVVRFPPEASGYTQFPIDEL